MIEENEKNIEFEQSVVKIVIDELIDRGFIRKDINTFERTKEILRKYNRIKRSTKGIDKQIKSLQKNLESISGIKPGMKKNAFAAALIPGVNMSDYDSIFSRINELEASKVKINAFLEHIKTLVDENANADDKDLFNRIFFESSSSVKQLCEELDCTSSSIYKRINNVVNKIYIELFPELYLDEICQK